MKYILILLQFLIFIGCAEKAEQTNLKVSLGAVTGSGNFSGGLFVVGYNSSGQAFNLKVPDSDVLEIEIPNGVWSFAAMGWDGSEHFEGNVYCENIQNINLSGGDVPINLVATQAKCSQSVFGPHAANNFLPITFNSCSDIKGHIANGELTDPNLGCDGSSSDILDGGAKSVRISMTNMFIGQNHSAAQVALTSKCYDISIAQVFTSIKLPFGNGSIPMPFKAETFGDTGCGTSNGQASFIFPKAFAKETILNRGIGLKNLSGYMSVYLHENLCSPAQQAMTDFANGSPGASSARLICNETHWNNINADISSYPGSKYIIGDDFEFTSPNTPISNAFDGSIQGNFHTISDGENPLFDTITTPASGDHSIRNIKLNDFTLSYVTTGSSTNYGVLAREFISSGSSRGYEISNIEITNSSITITDATWTGKAGGLIGDIDFSAASADAYASFRKNDIFVNITTDSGSGSLVGGFAGDVGGPSPATDRGIYFEMNRVGVSGSFSSPDFLSNRVIINSGDNVKTGGLFGQAGRVDIRAGHLVSTQIYSKAYTGGFVGDAQDNLVIDNSFAKLEYIPTVNNSSRVGGVVGGISGNFSVKVNGVVAHLMVPSQAYTLSRVGGVVGDATSYSSLSELLKITNSRTHLEIEVDGDYIGGLIGKFVNIGTASDYSVLNSTVAGKIETYSSAPSDFRGALIGEASKIKIKRAVTSVTVNGRNNLGGAIGSADMVTLEESWIQAAINSTGTSSINVGGLVGYSATLNSFDDIKLSGIVNIGVNTACSTLSCGKVVGNNVAATSIFSDLSYVVALNIDTDNSAISDSEICNGFCTGTELINTFNSESSGTCSSLNSPFEYDSSISKCTLIFEKRWREYGYKYDIPSSSWYYTSGSMVEPFEISSPDQWNAIGDDVFLVNKYFKLMDDLDFSLATIPGAGVFVPIGTTDSSSTDNIFRGGIIPNQKRISNIVGHSLTGTDAAGMFPIIENARIGLDHDPLRVEDSSFIANQNKAGIIGRAFWSNISIQAKGISISDGTTTDDVGGLIGYSGDDVRISNSSFEGSIDVQSVTNVGGLVGRVLDATGQLYIENSFTNLQKIIGADVVGGFVGLADTPQVLSIENSYVWIDKFDNHGTYGVEADIDASTNAGAIVGSVGTIGLLSMKSVYADVSNATLGSNTNSSCLLGGLAGAGLYNFDYPIAIIDTPTSCTQSSNDDYIQASIPRFSSHEDMANDISFPFEYGEHEDWWLDNGQLKVFWENPNYVNQL